MTPADCVVLSVDLAPLVPVSLAVSTAAVVCAAVAAITHLASRFA